VRPRSSACTQIPSAAGSRSWASRGRPPNRLSGPDISWHRSPIPSRAVSPGPRRAITSSRFFVGISDEAISEAAAWHPACNSRLACSSSRSDCSHGSRPC
jgi:hypothetical protein